MDDYLDNVIASVSKLQHLDFSELLSSGRILSPITEDAKSRMLVSGTGLTHLGSARQRDEMYQQEEDSQSPKSDSRKMFEMGMEGGRPAPGHRGAAPEWFYKGDGRILRAYGQSLDIPSFSPDGGEEPEVVGIYVVDDDGVPCRIGLKRLYKFYCVIPCSIMAVISES